MRRAHLYQPHSLVADLDIQHAGKGPCRRALFDILEVERREDIRKIGARRTQIRTRRLEHGKRCRRHFGHLPRAGLACDDLRLRTTSVAVAVVSVGMGVDDRADPRSAQSGRVFHRRQHFAVSVMSNSVSTSSASSPSRMSPAFAQPRPRPAATMHTARCRCLSDLWCIASAAPSPAHPVVCIKSGKAGGRERLRNDPASGAGIRALPCLRPHCSDGAAHREYPWRAGVRIGPEC
mgnify:CR=1 FL=1